MAWAGNVQACILSRKALRSKWKDNIKMILSALKPKFVHILFKNSIRTSKRTLHHHKDQLVNAV
jgi:hypothetical protein